eukprot:6199017-Pleurochrysis_carterae.AAC.2
MRWGQPEGVEEKDWRHDRKEARAATVPLLCLRPKSSVLQHIYTCGAVPLCRGKSGAHSNSARRSEVGRLL